MRDLNAAAEIDVGSILFMRVLKVGEEYEFSTSGLALPCEYGEQLLNACTATVRNTTGKRTLNPAVG